MPSSTSSSDSRRWAIAWLAGLALALLALGGWEAYWRTRGLPLGLIDSTQAWALQRDRVYDDDLRPVVFLGASRSVYGLDPKVWKAQRPDDKPLMLAVNGHYPVATLLELADDEAFTGLVVVDIDSYGLLPAHHDMQRAWNDYYRQRWNWNWRMHRLLLNAWQRHSLLANPATGLWPTLKRAWTGAQIVVPYSDVASNRAGEMRFDRTDVAALAAHFDRGVDAKIARFPAPTPQAFIAGVAPIERAVAALRARGGDVVFVNLPVQGRLVEMETRYMPRAQYWDAFAALPGIRAIHYEDVPVWNALVLPDRSHVKREDRAALTTGLVTALQQRGWLKTSRSE
jgi:hypothetical protein